MSMTKKDYEVIASVFADFMGTSIGDEAKEIALTLSYDLERNNLKFDRNKFLAACGVK